MRLFYYYKLFELEAMQITNQGYKNQMTQPQKIQQKVQWNPDKVNTWGP